MPARPELEAPVLPENARRDGSTRWWRHRHVVALAIALSACTIGSLAIYAIHRTTPAVPPGFERGERADVTVPAAPAEDTERPTSHRSEPDVPTAPAAQAPIAPAPTTPPPAMQAPDPAPPGDAAPPPQFQGPAPAAELPPATSGPVATRGEERLAALQQAQCAGATMLGRVVCNERVRLRYCRERWNAHPDCIVAAPSDPVQ
ncbi:MAG: hypothetical protein KJ011_05450 [Burkholderiaceae bacterium]|nr:hypothetical protein [Burkholderiaceae bacterium]